ncbi:MAG TPA: hypothetical protein VEH06_18045 [Candidatus Bathyarchaeia archaeon]|nr:hypothetical protein [Candidatus Bathyarchaeia archaeon]
MITPKVTALQMRMVMLPKSIAPRTTIVVTTRRVACSSSTTTRASIERSGGGISVPVAAEP